MAKPARKSPGVGRNVDPSDNLDDSAILDALATEVLQKEQMAALTEARKRSRKKAEAAGVPLAELDELYKHRDDPPSEVKAWFARKWRVFSAFFTDLRTGQMDAFATPVDAKAAFAHAGLMSGIKGEKPTPPPELVGEDMQTWLEAHKIGADRRKGASDQILLDAATIAAKGGGKATDGTKDGVTKATAQSVRDQAAADFAADNPDPPAGTVKPEIPMGEMVGDSFEMAQSELDQQVGRKAKGMEDVSDEDGKPVQAHRDDPLLFEGVLFSTKARLEAAKRRATLKAGPKGKVPQSAEAAAAREEAGIA